MSGTFLRNRHREEGLTLTSKKRPGPLFPDFRNAALGRKGPASGTEGYRWVVVESKAGAIFVSKVSFRHCRPANPSLVQACSQMVKLHGGACKCLALPVQGPRGRGW